MSFSATQSTKQSVNLKRHRGEQAPESDASVALQSSATLLMDGRESRTIALLACLALGWVQVLVTQVLAKG